MALAKITLYGMYRWMSENEDNLFGQLTVPPLMDADKLRETILYKGAEFEVLYGDPNFMKEMIGIWSDRWYATLDRWSKALAIEYNPLENYDRIESWTDAGNRNKNGSSATESTNAAYNHILNDETQTDSGHMSSATSTNGTHSGSNEHTVSAYDSSTYQADNKDTDSSNDTNQSATSNLTNNDRSINGNTTAINNAAAHSDVQNSENEQNTSAHSGRVHGNIGVLTSQAMLQSELDISRFNLYDEAADLFLQEFCVYTY